MQYVLCIAAIFALAIIVFGFPETSQPGLRGIDKLLEAEKGRFVWLNPLDGLWLLRSPNLLAVVSCGCRFNLHLSTADEYVQTMVGTVTLLSDYGQ